MTIYGMIAAHSTLVAYGRITARILIDAFSLIVVTYIIITAKTKLVTLHAICLGKTYNLVKTCLFSERPRGYKDHISMNCIYIDLSKPNFERKVRHDYVIAFPESKLYVLSLKENAILINFKLYIHSKHANSVS